MRNVALRTAVVLTGVALMSPINSALAAGVDTPAPDQGPGCTRHVSADVDSTKPMPVVVKAGVSC
jgi:hypothetical protein